MARVKEGGGGWEEVREEVAGGAEATEDPLNVSCPAKQAPRDRCSRST